MDSEVTDDIEHTVKDIFRSWDLNKNGFIEKSELACCCAELNLTKQEIEDLFNELDADKDNKISLLDFSKGFKRVCSLFEADVEELSTAEKERKKFDKLLDALGVRELLSGQEYVSDLFHYLHNSSESPQLVALLESFLFSVVRDVKHYSSENQRLEEALKRTCEKHSEHMDQLDNELEQQMQRLESRIRKEEKSKQERSNLDIVWQLENKNKEIQTLTARVQKLEGKLKKKEPEEQKIKEEVDDKVQEIRFLRSQLTDAQTNLAILRSELAQLRNDYEEQESQLTAEKRTVMECVQEQESLTRQLQLLHEANKKLHDTNDDLRAALEARKNSDKRSPSPSKRHSISTLYSPTSSTTWKNNKSPSHSRCSSGFAEDFGADSVDGKSVQSTPSQNVASSLPNSISNSRRGSTALLPSQQSCEVDDDSLAGESSLMTELMQVQQLTVPEDIPEEETKSTQQLDYNNNAGILNSRETGQVHHLLPPARQSCEVDDHVSLEDKSLLDEPVILGFCSMNFHRDLEDEDEAYNSLRSSERKSFSKQLDILQETNKRLCDSNDDLRAALEALTGRRSLKLSKARRSGEKCHRNPSIHSDYGSISSRSITPNHLQGPKSEDDVADGAEAEEPGELSGYEPESDVNTMTTDSLPESDNSKPDTFSAELEAQFKSVIEEDDEDIDEDDVGDEELAQLVAMARANTESEDDSETEAEAPEGERGAAVGSDSLSEASSNTPLHASVAESNVPERMYKLVLAGDAAVGKSSFILRLCRNRFHSALNSTLGVDFQMKTLVVDDKTIAFQLWDTAGQERFRSIAKSYFRKADGVLLLYDVTCETSFINVRDWVEAIEESTSKPIPIMLCGNKTDLRQSYIAEGKTVITEENGEKLAREYGALFTETSSKENKNITDACIELGRLLRKIEDTEVEQSNGLTLKEGDEKSKKKSCCLT
ncbi:ras and EF-hand domain-containing protein homolog isoform X6 [Pocillopora damicornis]|uniref:ras and EF-hand domain-containing protein homolog isoform X6 n=1 Tax=Pocillopora damicornis TaxID=46731 RepID=UPI000F558A7A|nr:ras and EF-hand domain-containing protein homolog isoform X6 [Pocillopora damicornis]XP_058949595.1 ras and EF-hand domain-containing protein homolog isoform X7 [Pocillopora verrucosa]